jgi:hypothetical protein
VMGAQANTLHNPDVCKANRPQKSLLHEQALVASC